VLLITDGLERGDLTLLSAEAERLALSCRRLIWLNPLLRWEEFEPKAGGIRTLLPHVDAFHACHSVDSVADLANALAPGRSELRNHPRGDRPGSPHDPLRRSGIGLSSVAISLSDAGTY